MNEVVHILDRQTMTIEARYRMLVDAITDYAIYMLDPGGYVTSWNTGAARCKGYSEEEIVGEHFSVFYSEKDRAAGLPEIALQTAVIVGRFVGEGWRLRKDRTAFWAHVVIEPIYGDERNLIGFAEVARDLSERRLAETDLAASEARFRMIVQSVTDYAIYMLDPTGQVTTWNAGAEWINGYGAHEIIGENFSCFFTPEDLASGENLTALSTATKDGRFEKEGWQVRKNGTRFWANVIVHAMREDSGRLVGFAKVTRDITEKMAAQAALDVKQSELFQAQKMEIVGQLTGGFAHDFNNLLMVMLGSLEMLEKRILPSRETTQLLDNAIQSGKRGTGLIKRMLAFSRQEQTHLEWLGTDALVNGMADLVARSIGPMIRLEVKFPPNLPKVLSDANQLSSALLNLAVNARDAMPNGGSLIISGEEHRVRDDERRGLPPGDYVCISIVDTGAGMSAETLARATQPFFTTKPTGKGTGLGLAMVATLLEHCGGKLMLQSTIGIGTVVDLWFPAGEIDVAPRHAGKQTLKFTTLSKEFRILAVDDDELVLRNTVQMLKDMGHIVLTATSGEEALDLLSQEPPIDLILTDYAMPLMNGSELADSVWNRNPALPIILATGYAKLPFGANPALPLIPKPFSQSQLSEMIESCLRKEARESGEVVIIA